MNQSISLLGETKKTQNNKKCTAVEQHSNAEKTDLHSQKNTQYKANIFGNKIMLVGADSRSLRSSQL